MKKLIYFLLITMISTVSFAQAPSAFTPKVDTTKIPSTGFKTGINRLDSQLVSYDRKSWKKVVLALSDTATIDFAQATSTTVTDVTKTISGARLGDEVVIGVPNASITATGSWFGWVSAANTVTIRYSPKATENPASGVFHITVLKYRKWY